MPDYYLDLLDHGQRPVDHGVISQLGCLELDGRPDGRHAVFIYFFEDLLEEVVGEIRDEYDSDEAELIKNVGGRKFLVEGNMKLADINDALGTELSSEDYDSIGGLMIENLDRLPSYGETVTLDSGITLTARGIKRNRITKVLMTVNTELSKEQKETL